MEPLDLDIEEGQLELPAEPMMLNMGPSHPAMHGTVRIVLELSGEGIVKADVQIGYLPSRRCASAAPGHRSSPPTGSTTSRRCSTTWASRSRWRRCSASPCPSAARTTASSSASSRGSAITSSARARWRWSSAPSRRSCTSPAPERSSGTSSRRRRARGSPTASAASAALTPPTPDFKEWSAPAPRVLQLVTEGELLLKNRIFLDRVEGVGAIRRETRWRSGGRACACGLARPERAPLTPYMLYDRFEFDVPVGTKGRQLRPLHVPLGGDAPVGAHHRPGARSDCPTRPDRHRRPARLVLLRSRTCTRPSKAPSSTSRS